MDLSPDIFLFLDDPDFMDIDRVDVTDNGHDNDVVQDGHKTASDRPIDKDMTNSPDFSAFFLGREQCVTNKMHKKNNRKYLSKLFSGKASTNVSPKPGTTGLQTIYLSDSEFEDSLYDHESQMSQSELQNVCCVCKKNLS